MSEKTEHHKCGICGKEITYFDKEGNICHHTHIDISRGKKCYEIEDGQIVKVSNNIKMFHAICQECFVKILNESATLGKIFLMKMFPNSEEKFII